MQIEEKSSGYKLRSFLLKLIIIIAIISLLAWILPKFVLYKKSNNIANDNYNKNIGVGGIKFKNNQIQIRDAALRYYNKDKLPQNVGDKVKITLAGLQKDNLISNLFYNDDKCSVNDSYAELTKIDNDYLLKINLSCGKLNDYLIFHVGEYEYCDNVLCEIKNDKDIEINTDNSNINSLPDEQIIDNKNYKEKDDQKFNDNPKQDEVKENEDSSNKNSFNKDSSNIVIGEFGRWSNYERASCSTQPVTCDQNDINCLQEVKIYKRLEQIGQNKITFKISPPLLEKVSDKKRNLCNGYNYVEINNILYYSSGNYSEVLLLNGNSTSSWHYEGRISLARTPEINVKKYYKFVGIDYSNCKDKCGSNIRYYYDVYTYIHELKSEAIKNCSDIREKSYQVYTLKNNTITKVDFRPVYATACYKSFRERNIEKIGGN